MVETDLKFEPATVKASLSEAQVESFPSNPKFVNEALRSDREDKNTRRTEPFTFDE
jgi:hypothetical protein